MMRYLLSVRGPPGSDTVDNDFQEEHVDIFHEEQLTEHYLCDINPLGQVPVLANPAVFSFPMSQTSAITVHMMERFPQLSPDAHKNEIMRLTYKMHELNFFTLSFRSSPKLASGFVDQVDRLLSQPGISERYKNALQHKRNVLQAKVVALEPHQVEKQLARASEFLNEIAAKLRAPGTGPWLFGCERPTALDAQLVVMIHRLEDAGRQSVVPSALREYKEMALKTPEYGKVMDERGSTMYDGSKAGSN